MENKTQKRNGFASGIGFILAAAGSAIGLGNLWSFPYKTAKYGGAAFVFTYILSVLIIGVIVMVAELHIGRRSQANPVSAYKKVNKNVGWLGLFAVLIPFFIICYYSVLGGYTVKYAMNSFAGNAGILETFTGNAGEVIMYTAIFMILAILVVMAGVKGGIEKASKVLMPTLFFILVAVAVYSLFLGEGVSEGLNFYLNPDFSELGFDGILAAMSQAFFSLSLGMGIMVSYGSYAGKEIKVGQSISMICIFDTMVALLAGLAIFPAVYHYQAVSGATNVETGGLLLMFQTLPLVFEGMGTFGQILSFFFFAMVVIAALTSVISLLEVVTQLVIQKFHVQRKKAILVVAAICFAISIPIGISLGLVLNGDKSMLICGQNWLDFFDLVTNVVLMPLGALGACMVLGWMLDKPAKKSDMFNPMYLNETLKKDGLNLGWFGKVFAVMVKYVTPLLILVVEIFGVFDIIMPANSITGIRAFSSNGLGIVLTAYGLCVVAIAVYFMFFKKSETGNNADELLIEEKQVKAE
ncbi:MAG: sodium-dependent transporter [Clostridia bacterium]|nr:sodium-dependent transporter [Clostridia bacterium]